LQRWLSLTFSCQFYFQGRAQIAKAEICSSIFNCYTTKAEAKARPQKHNLKGGLRLQNAEICSAFLTATQEKLKRKLDHKSTTPSRRLLQLFKWLENKSYRHTTKSKSKCLICSTPHPCRHSSTCFILPLHPI
jgi:hypothetical protein